MVSEGCSGRKLLLIVLLLCATVGAQTNALGAEQETHHGSQHCCRLCHIGPVPLLPSVLVAVAAPVLAQVWVAPFQNEGSPRQILLSSASSRAPPASISS